LVVAIPFAVGAVCAMLIGRAFAKRLSGPNRNRDFPSSQGLLRLAW
jgi:hypothetical protein